MAESPFRDRKEIVKEIEGFVGLHGSVFKDVSWKISALFEVSCYNQVVGWYVKRGYSPTLQQLDSKTGEFRYKVSPAGYPKTFSYFQVAKGGASFELRMNTAVQSASDPAVSITPDIVVADVGGLEAFTDREYFRGTREYWHAKTSHVITFFECKHMNAFPELFASFLGMVLQLRPECMASTSVDLGKGCHLAPGLLVSGAGTGFMAARFGRSAMGRYCANISTAMFKIRDPFGSSQNEWGSAWRVLGGPAVAQIPSHLQAGTPAASAPVSPTKGSVEPPTRIDDDDIPF